MRCNFLNPTQCNFPFVRGWLSASLVVSGRARCFIFRRVSASAWQRIINFPIIFRISTHSWLRAYINFRYPFIMRFVARRDVERASSPLYPLVHATIWMQSKCRHCRFVIPIFRRDKRFPLYKYIRVRNYSIVEITSDSFVAIFHPAPYIYNLYHCINKCFTIYLYSFIIILLRILNTKIFNIQYALFLLFFSFLFSMKSYVVNEILFSTFFSETTLFFFFKSNSSRTRKMHKQEGQYFAFDSGLMSLPSTFLLRCISVPKRRNITRCIRISQKLLRELLWTVYECG